MAHKAKNPKLLRAARRERNELLARLEKNVHYQRLMAVEMLIDAYEDKEAPDKHLRADKAADSAEPTAKTKTDRYEEGVAAYLRKKKVRAQTLELLTGLAKNGIKVEGKNPAAALSAFLSKSPLFDNGKDDRGQGYGLKEWSKAKVSTSDEETPDKGELSSAQKPNGGAALST